MAQSRTGTATRIVGFGLRIHAGGGKSFFLNYRIDGRERRYTIGAFPALVRRRRARAGEGTADPDRPGPRSGRAEARTPGGPDRSRPDSTVTSRSTCRRSPPVTPRRATRRKMLDQIGEQLGKHTKVGCACSDVGDMHGKITEKRGTRAGAGQPHHRVCSKFCSVVAGPRGGEDRRGETPCMGNHARALSGTGRRGGNGSSAKPSSKACERLAEFPGVAADCVRLIMLTGCRPCEAIARVGGIRRRSRPRISQVRTPSRGKYIIRRSARRIELIGRLRKKRKGKVVFPGDVPGEPFAALWHVWHFVGKRAELGADARLYDLRHTFAQSAPAAGLGCRSSAGCSGIDAARRNAMRT